MTVMENAVKRFILGRQLVTITDLTSVFHVKRDCMEKILKKLHFVIVEHGYIEKRKNVKTNAIRLETSEIESD